MSERNVQLLKLIALVFISSCFDVKDRMQNIQYLWQDHYTKKD